MDNVTSLYLQLTRIFLAPKNNLTTYYAQNLTDRLRDALANSESFPNLFALQKELNNTLDVMSSKDKFE